MGWFSKKIDALDRGADKLENATERNAKNALYLAKGTFNPRPVLAPEQRNPSMAKSRRHGGPLPGPRSEHLTDDQVLQKEMTSGQKLFRRLGSAGGRTLSATGTAIALDKVSAKVNAVAAINDGAGSVNQLGRHSIYKRQRVNRKLKEPNWDSADSFGDGFRDGATRQLVSDWSPIGVVRNLTMSEATGYLDARYPGTHGMSLPILSYNNSNSTIGIAPTSAPHWATNQYGR
jgi:hypothetical protein